MESNIIAVAVSKKGYPEECGNEVCFVGRSNCGKSSLINAIAGRKKLAKTSSSPGKTRTINFYQIGDAFVTDLPGYGFAKISKKEQAKWGDMLSEYFENRKSLSSVYILMDIRRIPSEDDKNMILFARHYNKEVKIILTKADKLSKAEQKKQVQKIATYFKENFDEDFELVITSANKRIIPSQLI
jgi:GTP-binding protein